MLKYAIILLDKTSVAFCHADNPYTCPEIIPLETLRKAIFWTMTENLRVQFVYPNYELSEEMLQLIDTIDHVDIKKAINSDVIVCDKWDELSMMQDSSASVVWRTSKSEIFAHSNEIADQANRYGHVSVVITDLETMNRSDFETYKEVLSSLVNSTLEHYREGQSPQINILTDRLQLDSMNNCNAGCETITIAPNGKFYVCPAFYYEDENDSIGDLDNGLNIPNSQLFRLDHSPICRRCDALQCRRCVWLNRKMTGEVNTPSHEQCMVSHLERNASRQLLGEARKLGEFLPHKEIREIDYLDPFDKINK